MKKVYYLSTCSTCKRIMDNLETILAIELLNGAQALEFRRPLKTSTFLESLVLMYRTEVSFIKEDKVLHDEIVKTIRFIQTLDIDNEELFN